MENGHALEQCGIEALRDFLTEMLKAFHSVAAF
jgi:hypothetical protein